MSIISPIIIGYADHRPSASYAASSLLGFFAYLRCYTLVLPFSDKGGEQRSDEGYEKVETSSEANGAIGDDDVQEHTRVGKDGGGGGRGGSSAGTAKAAASKSTSKSRSRSTPWSSTETPADRYHREQDEKVGRVGQSIYRVCIVQAAPGRAADIAYFVPTFVAVQSINSFDSHASPPSREGGRREGCQGRQVGQEREWRRRR